jgi:hypothetical protein
VNFVNICVKNQQTQQLFIQFINNAWQLLHVSALHCHLQGAVDRILWMGVLCQGAWCARAPQDNTLIHNILSTAPQLSISQKALGTLPDSGNVMPKHVGATICN